MPKGDRELTLARIQVKGAKIDSRDVEVLLEICPLEISEWIAAVRLSGEAHSLFNGERKNKC